MMPRVHPAIGKTTISQLRCLEPIPRHPTTPELPLPPGIKITKKASYKNQISLLVVGNDISDLSDLFRAKTDVLETWRQSNFRSM